MSSSQSENTVQNDQNEVIVGVILDKAKTSLLLSNSGIRKHAKNLHEDNHGFWFPYLRANRNETTNEATDRLLNSLNLSENPKFINVLRIFSTIFLPVNPEHACRIIYMLCESNIDVKESIEAKGLKWMNSSQMKHAQKRFQLVGLEPLQFLKRIDEKSGHNVDINFFFHEPRFPFIEPSHQSNSVEQLISSAKFSRYVQENLFSIYFAYSFPSEYINLSKFMILMEKILRSNDLKSNKLKNYFFSFDLHQKQILTFNDVLLGNYS